MTTVCSVPHLAYTRWYGSVLWAAKDTDRYAGSCSFEISFSATGYRSYFDYGNFNSWQPQWPGQSKSEYMPEVGKYGPGSAQDVTMLAGWNMSRSSASMASLTQYYYSLGTQDSAWTLCCDAGEDC
jgi:hypothetical protein